LCKHHAPHTPIFDQKRISIMIKTQFFALASALLIAGPALAAGGDAAAGKAVFQQCSACHAIGPGASNRVGPVLNGLIGRAAGTAEGYRYSSAMKNSGLTWDEATFTNYIQNPRGVVPGTKMSFSGLKNPTDVANVLAYIETFNADGSSK
jgi:cytochrome c